MTTYGKVSADIQPLAVGSMLMILIFTMGYLSGAHFNPAISLAMYLRGKLNLKDVGFYWIAQVLGAVAAAITTALLISAKPPVGLIASPPQFFAMIPAPCFRSIGHLLTDMGSVDLGSLEVFRRQPFLRFGNWFYFDRFDVYIGKRFRQCI